MLTAETVNRGYRVDVWDDATQAWHSLCSRIGTYHMLNTGLTFQLTDESTVTLAMTSLNSGTSEDQYLHDAVFRWDGWSLAAPRPSKVLDKNNNIADGKSTASTEFKMEVSFAAAPKTLPRLRYGRSYKVRLRAVDLAGNSIALNDPAAANSPETTTPLRFGRFEPVPGPIVLLRRPQTEGESTEHLVIRSNYNTPASADTQRHLAPPKVAELVAEEHGKFDVAGGLDHYAYDMLANRDRGTYSSGGGTDPASGQPYFDVNQLNVPHLPDPLAIGASFLGLPGTAAGQVFQVDFGYTRRTRPARGLGSVLNKLLKAPVAPPPGGPWPNGAAFRFVLVEGTGGPSWTPPTACSPCRSRRATRPASTSVRTVRRRPQDARCLALDRESAGRDRITTGEPPGIGRQRSALDAHAVRERSR